MDAFLRRVVEAREREQQEAEYLSEQPVEEESATGHASWDGLGPPITWMEDWLCPWCSEINRRRVQSDQAPWCRACFKNQKPCGECGGPVKKSDGDPIKPATICRACWGEIGDFQRDLNRAMRKHGIMSSRGRRPKSTESRQEKKKARRRVKLLAAKNRPIRRPKPPQTKPPRQPTGSIRVKHGSYQARWSRHGRARSKTFRTRKAAQHFLRSVLNVRRKQPRPLESKRA